jgi:hypothetical protein
MSLFQTQVERQFLAGVTTNLTPIYNKYIQYFGNPAIQANILELNEQQYQGEFVEALFVNILGYTAQPQPNFNLLREKKNETDAKSADAAISINNQIVAVIELKDHKTQDLKKVEVQAFGYKNNHKNCHYIVTSNFERLRFYIDNAVDFIEFDLFNLTFDEFRRLWLCLSYESIAKNLPQEIKNQSISSEDIITKKLYKDYSVFKRQLFDSIVVLNPEYDKLLLFKKTQKLLDRFLFLLFAEDKQLLPANSVKGTVDKWQKFNADPMNDYQPLYSRFVKYFKLLDVGYKDANTEIYAYNGGLFANDDLLNQIKIDDAILSVNVLKLAIYDYDTDVDVNILGHIFENSLNEIEQIANEISTGVKTTSKRKQDGVFYTPRYITQYIVENTVGKLCEDKKAELGIGEELFEYKRADKRKQALKIFDDYREWLLQITIVDPACGSGAFLNMALDFLMDEHSWIDRQQEKIAGLKGHYSMELSNIENTILENNLFGVDINEESVEIAKLSLWLRTAKPNRKLNSLNNNIKCGNSLIDDPAVAGDKAFNWQKEFPQVFGREEKTNEVIVIQKDETPNYLKLIKEKTVEAQLKAEQGIALSNEALVITKQLAEYVEKLELVSEPLPVYGKLKGGFDVVIGNPPYGATFSDMEKEFLSKLQTYKYKFESYVYFFEIGIKILKSNGYLGYITPELWLNLESCEPLRKYIFLNSSLKEINIIGENVFADAVVNTNITIVKNDKLSHEFKIINKGISWNCSYEYWEKSQFLNIEYRISDIDQEIVKKIDCRSIKLKEFGEVIQGITPYDKYRGQDPELIKRRGYHFDYMKDESCGKWLNGEDINRFSLSWSKEWLSYGVWLAAPREKRFFQDSRILFREIPGKNKRIQAVFTDDVSYYGHSVTPFILFDRNNVILLKKILCITNSKLISWYGQLKLPNFGKEVFPKLNPNDIKLLPINNLIESTELNFSENADLMLKLNKELHEFSQKFQRMLQRKFDLDNLPGKLQNWYLLSYKEFIAELGKKKVKLTLSQESEWEDFFTTEKAKALEIKKQIDDTDKEIDRMVYALYELTEEEVKIVEG